MTRDELNRELEARQAYISRRMAEQHAVPVVAVGLSAEPQAGRLVLVTGEDVPLAKTHEFLVQLVQMVEKQLGRK
jgi:hypothetical protein